MMNIRFTALTVVILTSVLASTILSCESYLDVGTPKSEIESDVVFSNDVTATSAMLGVYTRFLDPNSFASGTPYSILALAGLSSDELVNFVRDQNMAEFESNSINPANPNVFLVWSSLYQVIYQVNAIIEGVDGSNGLSDRVRDQLKGEALFVRAFCYLHLANLYGDVPLITTTDYRVNAAISRSVVDVVYTQILLDLNSAHNLLANEYAAGYGERIRPNKLSASSLLARTYLYLEDWENAELMASEVIEYKELYSLTDSLSDVFLMNSSESIWQLRPMINGDRGYTNEAYYFSISNILNYNVLRSDIVKQFENGDRRRSNWIDYLVIESDTVYYPRKYKQDQFSEYLTEYSSVLRLAEQHLIRAEARTKQNKLLGPNGAEADINIIRMRAGLNPLSVTTQDEIMNAIIHERRLELMAEGGHRWFDLKRWGLLETALGSKGDFEPTDELYPLPASEFRNNPLLKRQNDGY
jgi:hypothetical protein